VSAIVPGGQGLIRDADGIVLARGGLPGERVEVVVHRTQRRVRHGVVVRVIEASPARVATLDCALHPRCGGCDLLDLFPAAANDVRVAMVRDALMRIGKLSADIVAHAMRPLMTAGPGDDARRRRARFVIVDGRATLSAPASHERVPIERCPALHPLLEEALARVPAAKLAERTRLRLALDDRGHVSAALEGTGARDAAARIVAAGIAMGAVALDGDVELVCAGDPLLLGEVAPGFGGADAACASDAGVFTQATRFGGLAIVECVVDALAVRDGAAGPGMRVLELFAGAGHLTVPILERGAASVSAVLAIEGAPRGVRYLEDNVARFGERARVRHDFIDGALVVPGSFDVLVADPPRMGIPDLASLLDRAQAPVLVLVSCDVATGARDIAIAIHKGWVLDSLVPIDAFPRTSHVEWVARLSR
jgi:tRNA/tmRNA/rRNA uracil-C5-methylase (TrmA/RlmC/RlmD family)